MVTDITKASFCQIMNTFADFLTQFKLKTLEIKTTI